MSYERKLRTVFPDEDLAAVVAALGSDTDVVLAPGVHTLTDRIYINNKSRFSIRGGPDAIVRRTTAGGGGGNSVIEFDGTCEDVTIEGFKLENSFVGANDGQSLQFSSCTLRRIRFIDLTIYTAATGGNFEYLWCDGDNVLEDISFVGCIFYGDRIFNGIVTDAYGAGDSMSGLTVEGCIFKAPTNASGYTINFDGNAGAVQNVTIKNNVIKCGGFSNAVRVAGVYKAVIAGNVTRQPLDNHFYVDGNNIGIVVEGNYSTLGVNTGSQGGVATQGSDSDVVVEGNLFYSLQWDGVRVYADRMVVSYNLIYDPGASGVYVDPAAVDLLASGNLIYAASYGFYIDTASRIAIKGGCIVSTAPNEGIRVIACTDVLIEGVFIYNTNDQAIETTGVCVGIVIKACALILNTDDDMLKIGVDTTYATVTGNRLTDPQSDGIEIRGDYCLVAHNHIWSPNAEGIQFGAGPGDYADNGACVSNLSMSSSTDGIFIEYGREMNIYGNRSVGNTSNGIQENATSDQNLYALNHLRGNTGPATNFNGTNRTEYNNKT